MSLESLGISPYSLASSTGHTTEADSQKETKPTPGIVTQVATKTLSMPAPPPNQEEEEKGSVASFHLTFASSRMHLNNDGVHPNRTFQASKKEGRAQPFQLKVSKLKDPDWAPLRLSILFDYLAKHYFEDSEDSDSELEHDSKGHEKSLRQPSKGSELTTDFEKFMQSRKNRSSDTIFDELMRFNAAKERWLFPGFLMGASTFMRQNIAILNDGSVIIFDTRKQEFSLWSKDGTFRKTFAIPLGDFDLLRVVAWPKGYFGVYTQRLADFHTQGYILHPNSEIICDFKTFHYNTTSLDHNTFVTVSLPFCANNFMVRVSNKEGDTLFEKTCIGPIKVIPLLNQRFALYTNGEVRIFSKIENSWTEPPLDLCFKCSDAAGLPDGRLVVLNRSEVLFWDPITNQKIKDLDNSLSKGYNVHFVVSPDGKILGIDSVKRTPVCLWDKEGCLVASFDCVDDSSQLIKDENYYFDENGITLTNGNGARYRWSYQH